MENEVQEDGRKTNMLHRRKSFPKRRNEGRTEAKKTRTEAINEESDTTTEVINEESDTRTEAINEESDTKKKKKESTWTRWRKIWSFIPKKSCFLILGVLMAESLVENAVTNTLMTYLTDVRIDKLTTAAMTVNVLQVITGLLSVPATSYKDYIGCYHLTIISSFVYTMGLWLMSSSALSRKKICHRILAGEVWCHKIESPLFYIAVVFVGLGKAGFSSSCATDFLKLQVEAKLNEQADEESNVAIRIERKVKMAKNKYEREAIKQDENKRINIDDMTREDKIGTTVLTLSSIFKAFGVIVGNLIAWFLRPWSIRFGLSAWVLGFTLGLFIIGRYVGPYVLCGHCYTTKCTGGCNADNVAHPLVKPTMNVDNANVRSNGFVTNIKRFLLSVRKYKTLLLGMFPICFTFIMYGIVKSTGKSFFVEQGKTMDRTLGHIHSVPLPVLLAIGDLFGQCVNALVRVFLYRRLRTDKRIYGILTRIGFGLIFSSLCCGAAHWSENKRLGVVREKGLLDKPDVVPLSVFYLLFQFISYGAMKHLAETGLRVFFKYELPESMEGYASALSDTVIGIGVFLAVIAVPITQKLSQILGGKSTGWFADTINHSHLDYFYTLITIFCLLNLLLYAYVSTRYIGKRCSPNREGQNEEDFSED